MVSQATLPTTVLAIGLLGIPGVAPVRAAQDEVKIAKQLMTAAEQGSPVAQYAVGAAYEAAGQIDVAGQWYERAAVSGYAAAQFRFGEIAHKRGDVASADRWYRAAAAQGFQPAIDVVGDVPPAAAAEALIQPTTADDLATGAEVPPSSVSTDPAEATSAREQPRPTAEELPDAPATVSESPEPRTRYGITLFVLAVPTIGFLLASPFILVRGCHRRGLVLYKKRRHLLGYSLLAVPWLLFWASVTYIAIVIATSPASASRPAPPTIGVEEPALSVREEHPATSETLKTQLRTISPDDVTVGAVVLVVLLAPILHFAGARRLNPDRSVFDHVRVVLARILATIPACVSFLFFWGALSGDSNKRNSSRQASDRFAVAALIGWLFWGWLDYVCYPETDEQIAGVPQPAETVPTL